GSEEQVWGWPLFFADFALSVAAASFSWRFIEGPLAKVRKRLRDADAISVGFERRSGNARPVRPFWWHRFN
ncbi:MAG: hypothetical protein JWQ16_720, partial [Novosphingobium sp.]|nr:hypothetical protein [Novosphingobium sp.]